MNNNSHNCKSSTTPSNAPYSIEKPASDRPLEAYAVGRIYQLEAQVEDQKNHIIQLEEVCHRCADEYRELTEILKPNISLTTDGGMRKIDFDGVSIAYCKYGQDKYYKLVSLLGLQKENYQACMQEYENEMNNGTETDLSDDERSVVKNSLRLKVEGKGKNKSDDQNSEGDNNNAD